MTSRIQMEFMHSNKSHASTNAKLASTIYKKTLIAIGTSTGGPRALQKVLTDLPDDFSAPILIVQHMPKRFTKSLAERLNTLTAIHVKEAIHGEIIKNHTAYIAPGDYHMKARKQGTSYVIELTKENPLFGFRPAVDMLLDSFITLEVNKLAVILTGMGSDGSEGIKRLKKSDAKAVVVAEAAETAIVYGMPKAAVGTKCVNHIVPLYEIGKTMDDVVRNYRNRI